MNFLAHIYLSGDNEDILLGNFIADMIKGSQIEKFHQTVVDGVLLHRRIDNYTDTHHIVEQSKMRLRNKYRLFAGVIVDMYYDHFLARYWQDYSEIPLNTYVKSAYRILLKNYFILPVRGKNILPIMVASNWLVNYASLKHMQKYFEGMAKRTPFNSGMENAVQDLEKHYDEFESEFRTFFPQLVSYIEKLGISHDHHFPSRND